MTPQEVLCTYLWISLTCLYLNHWLYRSLFGDFKRKIIHNSVAGNLLKNWSNGKIFGNFLGTKKLVSMCKSNKNGSFTNVFICKSWIIMSLKNHIYIHIYTFSAKQIPNFTIVKTFETHPGYFCGVSLTYQGSLSKHHCKKFGNLKGQITAYCTRSINVSQVLQFQ